LKLDNNYLFSDELIDVSNESEQELKSHFQTATAMMLYQEGKLTIGKPS